MDVLYRIVHTATPAARTQALLLLFHVTVGAHMTDNRDAIDAPHTKRAVNGNDEVVEKRQDRFYRALYSTLADPFMLGTGKHLTMFFNLLYKALKYDQATDRVLGFVKRILATSLHCSSPILAASVFLVKEIAKYHPLILSCLQEVLEGPNAVRVLDPSRREPRGALTPLDGSTANNSDTVKRQRVADPTVKAALWEVSLMNHHYHPSVAKFAESLGNGTDINYSGDPLRDFGLVPFLDKFAYRNPKSSTSAQPGRVGAIGQRRNASENAIRSSVPVNTPGVLDREQVNPQDEFFRKFFVERARRDELKGVFGRICNTNVEGEEWDDDPTAQDALDESDGWDGSKRFEDWEREWKTDPEEEAFVDSVAQSLLECSNGKNGPSDLDEEDPDMGDWDDMRNDDVDDSNASVDVEDVNHLDPAKEESDDDFMDGDAVGSFDSEEDDAHLEEEESVTSFTGIDDMDGDSHSSSDNEYTRLAEESDDSEGSDQDDDFHPAGDLHKRKKPKTQQKVIGTFASLEEYEEKINESWHLLHYSKADGDETGHESKEQSAGVLSESTKKKKRSRKGHR